MNQDGADKSRSQRSINKGAKNQGDGSNGADDKSQDEMEKENPEGITQRRPKLQMNS